LTEDVYVHYFDSMVVSCLNYSATIDSPSLIVVIADQFESQRPSETITYCHNEI
jgi:hypothetical protein